MRVELSRYEAEILTIALKLAASRRESQARVVKYGRKHDLEASEMRKLRLGILRCLKESKS